MARAAVLLSALCGCAGNAAAQTRAPSEAESHSMYCVEVLRSEIALQSHLISASSEAAGTAEPQSREQWLDTSAELLQRLAKLEGALRRLQAYMLPRIPIIDSAALASEIRRANAEAQPSSDADTVVGRVRDCENPTWLKGEVTADNYPSLTQGSARTRGP